MTLQAALQKYYRALFKPNPYQRLTHDRRTLPDFVIIGAMRAGTTSLFKHLCQHPQVQTPVTKEVHYFDISFAKGENWYRAHFPLRTQLRGSAVTGESSPYYLFHPHAPRRMAALLPDVKLIILLRDPIQRAHSHYWHGIREGYETLSFEDAIRQEDARLAGEEEKLLADPTLYSPKHHLWSYKARGVYAPQVERWFRHFPREQILILEQKKFYGELETQAKSLCEFLGIDPALFSAGRAFNKGTYEPMGAEIARGLIEYFAPHNERLYALLGQDFGWGKEAGSD